MRLFKANQHKVDNKLCYLCDESFVLSESITLLPIKVDDQDDNLLECEPVHARCEKVLQKLKENTL